MLTTSVTTSWCRRQGIKNKGIHGTRCINPPVSLRTQNAISGTSWVTVCSIWAFFRSLHSNTWALKTSVTLFACDQIFFISVGGVCTEKVWWQSIVWTESTLWAWSAFTAPNTCISSSMTFCCFVCHATEISRYKCSGKIELVQYQWLQCWHG